MANEPIDDMAKLERIRGRIDLFRDSATVGPKGLVLEDMIWMEGMLRRLLKTENAQTKFSWVSMINNKPGNFNEKFFEKGFEWRRDDDEKGSDGRLK
jgi:hypothetical protein